MISQIEGDKKEFFQKEAERLTFEQMPEEKRNLFSLFIEEIKNKIGCMSVRTEIAFTVDVIRKSNGSFCRQLIFLVDKRKDGYGAYLLKLSDQLPTISNCMRFLRYKQK